jgi:hypothetical protein
MAAGAAVRKDAPVAVTRVVQLSDTHISAMEAVPASLQVLIDWIVAGPPDLVVVSGDIVREDPDDADDRERARQVLAGLPCPVAVIPGNHDIGFYDEPELFARRRDAFLTTWGADRFEIRVPGWQLVGLDAYALGDPEHDVWAAGALDDRNSVGVFVHQPADGDPDDGWQMFPAPRQHLTGLLAASATLRFVATGHRHCAAVDERPLPGGDPEVARIWAPSTTFVGQEPYLGGDPSPGAVEYLLAHDGTFTWRFVTSASRTVDVGGDAPLPGRSPEAADSFRS